MNTTMRPMSSSVAISQENARFMSSVYRWMTAGILITALISSYLGTNQEYVMEMVQNRALFYMLLFAQLGCVLFLSVAIKRVSSTTALLIFLAYSALTGVTLSTIFLIYTHDSIASVFFTTAIAFAGLSFFGYVTKRDLGPIGAFCGMALFGLIGWAILSFFFPSMMNSTGQMAYSIIGVVVFSGLTAYDTQKIKAMNVIGNEGTDEDRKEAIFGALILYLDFINLFLSLLRLMGDRRR